MSLLKSRSSANLQKGVSADQWLQSKREGSPKKSEKIEKKYSFLDDSSSEDSLSAADFIRKTKKVDEDETKKASKTPSATKPKTSRDLPETKPSALATQRSSALSRFAELEKQILSRKNTVKALISSSDMDLDISSDSDIKEDVAKLKKQNEDVRRTMKKTTTDLKVHKDSSKSKSDSYQSKQHSTRSKVTFGSLNQSEHSSSDISLNDFMPEQHSDDVSLDDVLPKKRDQQIEQQTSSVLLDSVDDLLKSRDLSDSENKTSTDQSDSSSSSKFEVHTIGELMSHSSVVSRQSKPKSEKGTKSTASVAIDKYSDDFDSDSDDTLKETESIDEEISEEIKTESSIHTEHTASDTSHHKSAYSTETFESTSDTSSASQSSSSESTVKSYSDKATSTSESSSTSTTTSSSRTDYHRRPTYPAPKRVDVGVQTDPVEVTRKCLDDDFLSKFADSEKTFYQPRSIINNEALSVLSAYSPNVLALHEMLKQQLAFTRSFIQRSDRLYKAVADTLIPDYQYASLDEAKKTINMQRTSMNMPPKYETKQ